MQFKRTLIAAALLGISAMPALAQLKAGPINITGQAEYSISDRVGKTEQGDNKHRQRSHPGFIFTMFGGFPLEQAGWDVEMLVSTKLVMGDATPGWQNSFGNREAWVGLNNSNAGKVRFGRQWLDNYISVMDAYASGGNIGELSELGTGAAKGFPAGLTRISNAIWADNALQYISPKLGGIATLRGQFYWNGASFSDDSLATSASPNTAPNTKAANGYVLGARFDLPAVRLDASYATQTQNLKDAKDSRGDAIANGLYDSTQLTLGAIVPVGAHSVRVMYNRDTTKVPAGTSLSDTDVVLGGQYVVTPAIHLRPEYIKHKVNNFVDSSADWSQLRVEFGYKMNVGQPTGSTTFWYRPSKRNWAATGESFTEHRLGFTANF